MAYLYVTTDSFEAETLIEDTAVGQEPKHKYSDMDPQSSGNLVKRIGFTPMCSIEMDKNISARELEFIASRLVNEGLYVATEMDGRVQIYTPNDAEAREEMVKLSLQKEQGIRFGAEPSYCLVRYSNRHDKIREF